jgi:hypothetical protein
VKTQNALSLAIELFSRVRVLKRVDADLEDDLWERAGVDFTFIIEGDLYDAETRIIPLIVDFMLETEYKVEFVILPAHADDGPHGILVYSREGSQGEVEARRASR